MKDIYVYHIQSGNKRSNNGYLQLKKPPYGGNVLMSISNQKDKTIGVEAFYLKTITVLEKSICKAI